jgi:DNA helicase-2/ATP-dependent DNA helicase PcrA
MPVESLEQLYALLPEQPNDSQDAAVRALDGPQLIVAGPGSGKTQVLVERALHLLLIKRVPASRVLLCTYTNKAAATLSDRIRRAIRDAGTEAEIDLSEAWIGTIHSICARLIDEYPDEAGLAKGYTVLDQMTQLLFIHESFDKILPDQYALRMGKWKTIKRLGDYFNKIVEDMVDVRKLLRARDLELRVVARAFVVYEKQLHEKNSVDFAHLQSIALSLLKHAKVGAEIRGKFDYIMVDEYQDTNFLQALLLERLASKHRNICVVGDEDQSLYRFRGATVLNFLQFPLRFKGLKRHKLETNYRSTQEIVAFVDRFIKEVDWTSDNPNVPYRFDKNLQHNRPNHRFGVPSIVRVDESAPKRVARLVRYLIDKKVVVDPNQIALLFHSVAGSAGPYIDALRSLGIESYSPRGRQFFNQEEVMAAMGCLLQVTDFLSCEEVVDPENNADLEIYYRNCVATAQKLKSAELRRYLKCEKDVVERLSDSLKKGIVDIYYEVLGQHPFVTWLEKEEKGRNLAMLSTLLTAFQEYYHAPIIHARGKRALRLRLFNSFFYVLRGSGLNQYEDPRDVFPKGKVQIMTVHQAKGLEFPVVIVGSLDRRPRTERWMDQKLEFYSKRRHSEPWDSLSTFDHYREFYVAFSRAKDLLVLACDSVPHRNLQTAFSSAPPLTPAVAEGLCKLHFEEKEFLPPKREFSITGDIHSYDVCPRQYRNYGEFGFTSGRSAGQDFGSLVHLTIEDVHKHVLHKRGRLTPKRIDSYFEKNVRAVTRGGVHPLAQIFKDLARKQVQAYYERNRDSFSRIVQAEAPIVVDRPDYVMTGVVDLIQDDQGNLEVLDFKAQERSEISAAAEEFYRFQLAVYSRMIERKLGRRPARTFIYLTGESDPSKAKWEVPLGGVELDKAEAHFDDRVHRILKGDFRVRNVPRRDVCRNCDFRFGCAERRKKYPSMNT